MNTVLLDEITESVTYGHTASASFDEVGPKFLRITDIQNGRVNWDAVPFCPCPSKKLNQYRLQRGDIVFARTGATTGKSFLIGDCPSDSVFASYLIRVRPTEECVDSAYLCHYFNTPSYWAQIGSSSTGSTQPGVNATKLKKLSIPLPPLEEQRRIVEILDAAQGLIDQRKEQLALMDQLVQSLFYDMFGDPVTNPMGWVKKVLDEVCSKITDGEHGTVKRVDHGVMYLMARNVMKDGTLSVDDVSYISEEDHQKINKRCNPEVDDLLLVCVGATIGKLTLVPNDFPPFSIARSVALLKPVQTSVAPSYLFALLNSERMQNVILENRNTSAQAGLYLGKIKPITICVPPLALQTEFAERVSTIEAQKATMTASLSELEDTFNALMQRAFAGNLKCET